MKKKDINKTKVIPALIAIVQTIGFAELYYAHRYKSGHFPADLVELNILAICNIIILLIIYPGYFKADKKENLWIITIALAILPIMSLIVVYSIMLLTN